MMKYNILILMIVSLLGISPNTQARESIEITSGKRASGGGNSSIAANCTQPNSRSFLEINNIRALIHTGGDMWWDLNGQAEYEVPSGSGRTALFAGSLWLGGEDISGQLKLAALRFRATGTDFWTGPLSTVDAEIGPETCSDYDKHYRTLRSDVSEFREWFRCNQDPDCNSQEDFPGYQIPASIIDWPAHGNPAAPFFQDYYLAPFFDNDGDGNYNPQEAGDYPRYDLDGTTDCGQRIVDIYGDENLWWVFNDKGNIHTETGGEAIGMEIRAQAFGFATNDEVNNMTFYNYELINRSTFQLTNTYFGFFVDADLGNAQDDYVGCDVSRGLGYAYNGDEDDESAGGAIGYGTNPPAIGVDFFQGPFKDNDQIDNCLCVGDYAGAIANNGIPYSGLGVGYGDSVVDNERLGMRAFLYFINGGGNTQGDPITAPEYYNYLRSFWRDNSRMVYGGQGIQSDFEPPLAEADYLFPGDSDPVGWGTGGVPRDPWTEVTAGNQPGDRRFVQSSGPFVLAPGAVNNVTVGVVWSRANSGGANASVQKLLVDDQKTQALFDACFQLLDGPDAPIVDVIELDQEIVLTISNSQTSNNFNESYAEIDPFIVEPPNMQDPDSIIAYKTYRFQGYQIYQLADASVSASDIYDDTRARLVFQTDVKDSITDLTNYIFDQEVEAEVALPRVTNANNDGVLKSVKITQDLFAEGDRTLINHKTYYFMAIAYAHNNFKTYVQNQPGSLDGQKTPYLPSRKSSTGAIPVTVAIPHKPEVKNNGTVLSAEYGQTVPVTKVEGIGNSGFVIDIADSTVDQIMSGAPWSTDRIGYLNGFTPVEIKVVDPLNVVAGTYTIQFRDSTSNNQFLDNAYWEIIDATTDSIIVSSSGAISTGSEELVPGLGISVRITQETEPGDAATEDNGALLASIEFTDPSKEWLTGFINDDGNVDLNWIRSGSANNEAAPEQSDIDPNDGFIDPNEDFEDLITATWAPFRLAGYTRNQPSADPITTATGNMTLNEVFRALGNGLEYSYQMQHLTNVNVYITSDQSKWTRSPVIEAQEDPTLAIGGAQKMHLRRSLSVDKNGLPFDTTGYSGLDSAGLANLLDNANNDPNSAGYTSIMGMGWFPGYAIDIETGERLNIAFGEDSYLISDNGNDMIWNPTSTETAGPFELDKRFGGKHFIYIFRNNVVEDSQMQFPTYLNDPDNRMPAYDAGQFIASKLALDPNDPNPGTGNSSLQNSESIAQVWRACNWVSYPRLVLNQELLATDVTVKLRVTQPYQRYAYGTYRSVGDQLTAGIEYLVEQGPVAYDSVVYERGDVITGNGNVLASSSGTGNDSLNNVRQTINGGLPLYEFSLDGLEPRTNLTSVAEDALDIINVVPNPYYAYSTYETSKIDNRVKIVNLPERANIKIYTLNGILVREFKKDDPSVTSIDWDLKNHARIPIASGVYLIHVDVPGIGEHVIKWFAVMRPVDLDSF